MTKPMNAMNETVLAPKHAFRPAENRPGKAHQRRYERRKVKEYIKLRNWQEQDG